MGLTYPTLVEIFRWYINTQLGKIDEEKSKNYIRTQIYTVNGSNSDNQWDHPLLDLKKTTDYSKVIFETIVNEIHVKIEEEFKRNNRFMLCKMNEYEESEFLQKIDNNDPSIQIYLEIIYEFWRYILYSPNSIDKNNSGIESRYSNSIDIIQKKMSELSVNYYNTQIRVWNRIKEKIQTATNINFEDIKEKTQINGNVVNPVNITQDQVKELAWFKRLKATSAKNESNYDKYSLKYNALITSLRKFIADLSNETLENKLEILKEELNT